MHCCLHCLHFSFEKFQKRARKRDCYQLGAHHNRVGVARQSTESLISLAPESNRLAGCGFPFAIYLWLTNNKLYSPSANLPQFPRPFRRPTESFAHNLWISQSAPAWLAGRTPSWDPERIACKCQKPSRGAPLAWAG